VIVDNTKIQVSVINGNIGHLDVEVMLDSGSSISLLAQHSVKQMNCVSAKPVPQLLLKAASDIRLPIFYYLRASVRIQNMELTVNMTLL